MFAELDDYQNQGHFFFRKGDSLAVQSRGVPNLPGVYYILRLAKGNVDLVYIGKSGTMLQNGSFKNQLLRTRLNNKQGGVKRQQYFDQKMEMEHIEALDIFWFVTFEGQTRDLPGYVEGVMMQRYFEVYGCLPPWNREC